MTKEDYDALQDIFSQKLYPTKPYYNLTREGASYNEGVIACKAVLLRYYKKQLTRKD